MLGVLVAIAGLALATLSGSRSDRVMTEAVDRAAHGVAAARASAMLEGRTLALYARPRTASQWMLAVADISEAGDDQAAAAPLRPRPVAVFPDGVTLQGSHPRGNDDEEASDEEPTDPDGPIALLLPDGRCLPRTELVLTYKDQSVRLRLRRLSPGVERVGDGP